MATSVSIGTAWTEAAAFVRREKTLLAPLVLALMVVPATVSQLVQPSNPFAAAGGFQPWMAVGFLALVLGLAGQMAVSRLAMGWNGSLGEAILLAFKRLPIAIAALILFFLCISLILLPILIVLALVGGVGGTAGLANLLVLFVVFGAAPRILLAPAMAMDRGLGPWALVKATWRATRPHYWRLVGFFFLFLAASLIFAMAVGSVIGTLATLALGPAEPMTVSRLVVSLVGGLVQGGIATVYAAMIGRIVSQLEARSTSGT